MPARDEPTDARYRAATIIVAEKSAVCLCVLMLLRSMIRHLAEPDITGVTSAIAAERTQRTISTGVPVCLFVSLSKS